MTKPDNTDFARFVASLLPSSIALGANTLHRPLIAFHAGVLLEFVKRTVHKTKVQKGDSSAEATLAWLLPSAIQPLQECSNSKPDVQKQSQKQALLAEVIVSTFLPISTSGSV